MLGGHHLSLRGGAGFDAVEGKSRKQRWIEKVAVAAFSTCIFEARKRKNPAGGLGFFRTNSRKLRLPSEDVGFRSTRTRGHARRLSGCAAVVLEVGELHGRQSLHAAGADARGRGRRIRDYRRRPARGRPRG
ncbi:Hypothetical protein EPM1_2275 [Stenotrophomonas maltophilia EPM1]|nr:Hypothetical protein EPM1_2275 [Stenotrophomonas maltophilia EPM1]